MPVRNNFLQLLRGSGPKGSPTTAEVRIWAAADGSLWTTLSDGTAAPVAGPGALPNPTDDGDVLTVVEGEWAGAPGGGSQPGAAIVRGPFPIAFDTPGISSGVDLPIIAVDLDAVTITVAGDHVEEFPTGFAVGIHGSTGNDNSLSILGATLVGGDTVIHVDFLQDPTADGFARRVTMVDLFTPTIGDVWLDAWVEVDTAWDGTTPRLDIGTGYGLHAEHGFFDQTPLNAIDMTVADLPYAGVSVDGMLGTGSANMSVAEGAAVAYSRLLPASFMQDGPLRCWVTRDHSSTGADPGATQGAARIYLVTATPVAP